MQTREAHRLYIHLAWTTLARVPALEPKRRAAIETHLLASCRWFGTDPIEVCALPAPVPTFSSDSAMLPLAFAGLLALVGVAAIRWRSAPVGVT